MHHRILTVSAISPLVSSVELDLKVFGLPNAVTNFCVPEFQILRNYAFLKLKKSLTRK